MKTEIECQKLIQLLRKIPTIKHNILSGLDEKGNWWLKFRIDIHDYLSWNVIQELACVCNYISLEERLPTRFYPVSPAPYLNGGPNVYLAWIIESCDPTFTPDNLILWFRSRLPNPLEDRNSWIEEE